MPCSTRRWDGSELTEISLGEPLLDDYLAFVGEQVSRRRMTVLRGGGASRSSQGWLATIRMIDRVPPGYARSLLNIAHACQPNKSERLLASGAMGAATLDCSGRPRSRVAMLAPFARCSPPPGCEGELGGAVAVVVRVQRHAGCDELVDAVEDLDAQHDVGSWQLGFELLHGARADDR